MRAYRARVPPKASSASSPCSTAPPSGLLRLASVFAEDALQPRHHALDLALSGMRFCRNAQLHARDALVFSQSQLHGESPPARSDVQDEAIPCLEPRHLK